MKEFKEVKNLGPYVPDICVKKTEGGGYVTVKSEGKLIPLNDAEVACFKEQVKKGEDVRVIDLSEENFMRMEFTDTVSGIDVDLLNQMSEQKNMKKWVK